MNIEQAIKHFMSLQKRYITTHNGKHCEYVKMALAALREKAERENPKPLTLEQLKERVGKPVWAEWLLVEDRKIETGGWFIVVKTKNGFEVKRPLDFGSHVCKLGNYETGWLAYDHEPKESHK